MKKYLSSAIFLTFLCGCSSSTNETNSKTNLSTNLVVNSSNTNTSANAVNSSGSKQEVFTANSFAARSGKGKVTDVPPIAANVAKITKPAPDNSVISSAMNNQGIPIETRAFKNHPILLKVEKIFADIKNPETRVYLKNGKIIEITPGKISNVSTASADEILQAIGIAPKVSPQKNVSTKKED